MSGAATVQKDDRDAPSSASSRRSSLSSTDTSPPPPSSASLFPSIAHVTVPSIPQTSCGCNANARNLVLCIDGTSNQFGGKNTNVVELYSRLVKDNDHQVTFYNSGIGTYVKPSWTSFTYIKQTLGNYADMGIAWNFERIVLTETKKTWSGGTAGSQCLQAIAFSTGGELIAIGGDDNRPSLWSKDVELALAGGYADTHSGSVMCLAFSKSGSFLVSGSQDHDLRIWTVASESDNPSRVLRGHSTWVTSVCVDNDNRIYSSSGDSLRIWDTETTAQLFKYDVTTGSALLHMSLSADGKRLVTASNDGTITLRDVRLGDGDEARVRAQIVGHRERVWSVGFSPDGSKIVSASQDKTDGCAVGRD